MLPFYVIWGSVARIYVDASIHIRTNGAISQDMAPFLTTAVIILNHTYCTQSLDYLGIICRVLFVL
jgi:hypothetical protein